MQNDFPLDWSLTPVADCMAAIIDYRGKSPRKTTFGIPLVTAKIVKGGRLDTPDEFIAPEDYVSWMRRGIPERGDVVMTTEAPLGEAAQLDGSKIALAQRLITLRGKHGVLDNTFLKFAMQSPFVQDELKARATGTTVLGIRQSELRKVRLPLPPIEEQRAIAEVLGTLDDKIELNRRMNETLEQIVRAIFKSWFVDFDPVRAKSEGQQPLGLDPETAARYPDSSTNSPIGTVPKGWTKGRLGDVAVNPRRGVQPHQIAESTPYIALEHVPRRCIALGDWGTVDGIASGKFQFRRGEILFGKLRPYFHKVGIAPLDGVCSTDILVIAPTTGAWFSFVLGHVSSDEFVAYTHAGSTGTRMPRTNWSDMARFEVVLPPESVAVSFDRHVRGLTDVILTNVLESRTLAAVRDALLPKLLSGEIRVMHAGRIVERVV